MGRKIKAKDYVCEWTENKYKGGKELGDWTTDEVIEFAEDFARKKFMVENGLDEEDMINDNKPPQEL